MLSKFIIMKDYFSGHTAPQEILINVKKAGLPVSSHRFLVSEGDKFCLFSFSAALYLTLRIFRFFCMLSASCSGYQLYSSLQVRRHSSAACVLLCIQLLSSFITQTSSLFLRPQLFFL